MAVALALQCGVSRTLRSTERIVEAAPRFGDQFKIVNHSMIRSLALHGSGDASRVEQPVMGERGQRGAGDDHKRAPIHTYRLHDFPQGRDRPARVPREVLRAIDHDIATGVWPDMTEHGWESDAWPTIYDKVLAADILVLAGPIWWGDNSSVTKQVIERLYACSHLLNDAGQYAYYGRVGGCLITGNEDGVKHCAMNVLYSLQHLGYTIPPQADAGWIGEVGPGPSYLNPGSGGPENDFTNRNTTFMTWNLMHLARMLKDVGGIPAHGNQRSEWDAGCRFDFENPDYR